MEAEKAHDRSMFLLSKFPLLCSELFHQDEVDSKYQVSIGPLNWSFPVGLAAGLDKNAEAIAFFSRLYFGAIEVGTVTPRPQVGNSKPRLFRLTEHESLRNKMGFNNDGIDQVLYNIEKSKSSAHQKCLGINLGKNKETTQDNAINDYKLLYQSFASVGDYLVINISSPNTPGLRDLQDTTFLQELFDELSSLRREKPCPLFLKLSPDIPYDDLPPLLDKVKEHRLDGVIATNTTLMKEQGEGGISGKLLSSKAQEFRNQVLSILKEEDQIQVIGVGGISSFEDIEIFWRHGGKAVQLYSSFVFQGPSVLQRIKDRIDEKMNDFGVSNLEELISIYRDLNN